METVWAYSIRRVAHRVALLGLFVAAKRQATDRLRPKGGCFSAINVLQKPL